MHMAAGFLPDSRNSGGRKTINDQLWRHQRAVLLARPAIDTRTRQPPHPKPRSNTLPMDEVAESFRRVAKVALSNPDITQPQTFGMASQLSQNRARKLQAAQQEHQNNVKHMLRRIRALDSEVERKKNPNDPFANPALFFRKPEEVSKYHTNKTAAIYKNTSTYTRPVSALCKKVTPQTQKLDKPSTPPPPVEVTPVPVSDTPEVHLDDPDPQSSLQSQLLSIIVSMRIYTDSDLSSLFQRTRLTHPHLPVPVLDAAISTIQSIIDG